MSQKIDKDKQKALQEKYQLLLADLLRLEENKYCVDCDAKGPRWASWNLGVFLCIRCAGIHRNLGVHVSRVKSVNLDSWTPEQIAVVQEVGNAKGRAIYEANLPENFRRPQTDSAMEALIRAKYEHKKYVSRDWLPSQQQPKAVSSVQEQAKKEKKRSKSSLGEQAATHERSLGNVKNASESNLVGSRLAERRERSEPSASTAATPNRKVKEATSENLPPIELISLASPEQNFDATEFGSFVTAPATTVSTSSTAAATAAVGNGASSDLADLDPFPGSSAVNASQPVAGSSNGSATGSSMQATKEDILALFGPSSTAGMFGVPGGGMYVQRQPVMCQTGGMQQAPMMPTGLPMMQPMMAMGPVMQPVNGPMTQVPVAPAGYGLYQGYPQAQMQQMTPGAGVVWCPTQQVVQPAQQQIVAGHTLSNVLWQ